MDERERAVKVANGVMGYSHEANGRLAQEIEKALLQFAEAARREERKRCAEYVEAQKAKYPREVFKHLDNFKAAGCLDCCSAAAILHTLDWLAKALSTLEEKRGEE